MDILETAERTAAVPSHSIYKERLSMSNKIFGVIYKATNLINGKCYIGQTIRFKKRKYDHIFWSINELDNFYFHNSIRKHGVGNFSWEIIYECDDKLLLNVMETFKIMTHHSHVSEGKGYNLTWGGDVIYGRPCSEETKEKIRQTQLGKHITDETRIKNVYCSTKQAHNIRRNKNKEENVSSFN